MIDETLQHHLEKIEKELKEIRIATTSLRSSLVRGFIYGAGYVIGVVMVIVLVGWILNIVGVIPLFNDQVNEFRAALNRVNTPVK